MKFHKVTPIGLILLFYLTLSTCQARPSPWITLLPGVYIYGRDHTYQIKDNDTLVELAVKFRVGYLQLLLANPGVDPWVPPSRKVITIPGKILIPKEFQKFRGIVVNLPEMRLYYFKGHKVFTAPVGIGAEGKLPPSGIYSIVKKKKDPFWYPPPSIREEEPDLPRVVPPGPDNPMGKYALYLSRGLFAIHGTNKVFSIGRRSTHGCIRLYPEDIKFLFYTVPLHTPVWITYEPYKLAIEKGKIFLQCYPDVEHKIKDP
jgi:L,D-transpeptidase ErfK/SrfK